MTGIALLVVMATGIVAGFLGRWWDQAWIWTSLGLLIALWVAMSVLGTRFYDRVRLAVGTDPVYGAKKMKERLALILWLMVLKPF